MGRGRVEREEWNGANALSSFCFIPCHFYNSATECTSCVYEARAHRRRISLSPVRVGKPSIGICQV